MISLGISTGAAWCVEVVAMRRGTWWGGDWVSQAPNEYCLGHCGRSKGRITVFFERAEGVTYFPLAAAGGGGAGDCPGEVK